MSKCDRDENRQLKSLMWKIKGEAPTDTPVKAEPDFTIAELKHAISRMKSRGAPGPDNIPPLFLKHLGSRALDWLLHIFNVSLRNAEIPQVWRNAIIIPLLKSGKSPSELASYRPISLTSCIMKLLERMISERLYDMAEKNSWFSCLQAGFRKSRGVEDQILRFTQQISDGFQRNEKSIMALLDFSKAYDTIWRQRLLLTLSKRGVPNLYVSWLNQFLQNRQARVRFNGMLSKSRKMNQGLPQGSVLAPILFLFYIDELAKIMPTNVTVSLYADDVSILASSRSKTEAEDQAQQAVDTVKAWSDRWKLRLNGVKSEVSTFSLSNEDSTWRPQINIDNTPLRFEPNPKLLGVTLDRRLTFTRQVELTMAKASSKMRMLGAVAHSKWGWRKEDLRKVYLSHVQSTITFASSAWQPWLSKNNINRLDSVQNKCLRLITSQAKSSPLESLRAETRIPSISSIIDANCLKSSEKAFRLPSNHPRSLAREAKAPKRLKSRKSFRQRADDLTSKTDLNSFNRVPLTTFKVRPWLRGIAPDTVFPYLAGIDGKWVGASRIREAALHRARELDAQYNIFTDGSAREGIADGGAGLVVTTGEMENPTIIDTRLERGAPLTCSFEEEKRAMQMALSWIEKHLTAENSVAVFTDSQSLCMALIGDHSSLDTVRYRINSSKAKITIQWIPGHCNIAGNEAADAAAKSAAKTDGPVHPISFNSACTLIRKIIKDPPNTHPRTHKVYSALSRDRERLINSREDQSLLAKLRSGHYVGLRAYKNRIDPSTSPTCNLCGEEDQDLEHWLVRCPATAKERLFLFGEHSGSLDCLTRFPRESLTLGRKTLLGEKFSIPPSHNTLRRSGD